MDHQSRREEINRAGGLLGWTAAMMSTEHARCLAMAYELHRLLAELYDRPDGGGHERR